MIIDATKIDYFSDLFPKSSKKNSKKVKRSENRLAESANTSDKIKLKKIS